MVLLWIGKRFLLNSVVIEFSFHDEAFLCSYILLRKRRVELDLHVRECPKRNITEITKKRVFDGIVLKFYLH